MTRTSAGLLLYRGDAAAPEVLLVHPGGPYWARKDAGAWSIPKGEHGPSDDPLECARREFTEELGAAPPDGDLIDLGTVRQSGGKQVRAWAARGELDPASVRSNTFTLEWPPRSGITREFPEIDRAEWFTPEQARAKLNPAQTTFLDRLIDALRTGNAR